MDPVDHFVVQKRNFDMRKLLGIFVMAVWALMIAPFTLVTPAFSADPPQYTPPIYDIPDLPPVDYGLGGSFYLRGSVGGAAWTATDGSYCGCIATFTTPGYGYSVGVGFGYETGDGLRGDITLDYLSINRLTTDTGHTVDLRSGLLLANAYYDFNLSGYGTAEGGFGAYLGAGIGFAKNYSDIEDTVPAQIAWGTSVEAAAAVMAGVTYDMGNMVADLGYRGVYMNKVMSQPPAVADTYIINNNFIHELRATLRYRFN